MKYKLVVKFGWFRTHIEYEMEYDATNKDERDEALRLSSMVNVER